jgi:uncharacterized surface protein with fasciclin (FAS1) repeats
MMKFNQNLTILLTVISLGVGITVPVRAQNPTKDHQNHQPPTTVKKKSAPVKQNQNDCQTTVKNKVETVKQNQNQPPITVNKKSPSVKEKNIVNMASVDKNLTILTAALKAAGLVETLQGKGPFTVFAPTNSAFSDLPKGTLEDLLKPENKHQLIKILTYHVVPGNITSQDLKAGDVTTGEGSIINVQIKKRKIILNNAKVIKANIGASNGVIHVIDKVILPTE